VKVEKKLQKLKWTRVAGGHREQKAKHRNLCLTLLPTLGNGTATI